MQATRQANILSGGAGARRARYRPGTCRPAARRGPRPARRRARRMRPRPGSPRQRCSGLRRMRPPAHKLSLIKSALRSELGFVTSYGWYARCTCTPAPRVPPSCRASRTNPRFSSLALSKGRREQVSAHSKLCTLSSRQNAAGRPSKGRRRCLRVAGVAGVHGVERVGRVEAVGCGHVGRVLRLVVHARVARHRARQARHARPVRHLHQPRATLCLAFGLM